MKYCQGLLYGVAAYCLGVAFIASLPPWEGYDEVAHYSYAQELSDTGQSPSFRSGKISADVERYQLSAPMPYSTVPPFNRNGGLTYRQWSDRDLPHQVPTAVRLFSPGIAMNWQAQHPPLYYRLMAPLVSVTADLSWTAQLFWLRLASWSLAFSGLVIAAIATHRAICVLYPAAEPDYWRVVLAWPLLFPGVLPEFARLGNDSLVVLLFSLVWAWLVQRAVMPLPWWRYMILGVLLGLGGITKVTFLPISAVVFVWLLWLGMQAPATGERNRTWLGAFIGLVLFLAMVGRFYLANFGERSSLTGLVELSDVASSRPLLWLEAFEYPLQILKGLLSAGLTFIWGATASSAYPPVVSVMPLLLLSSLLIGSAFLDGVGRSALALLAAGLLGGVFAGLVYYLLIKVATTGLGSGVPGWYLHVLMAPISLLLALGAQALRRRFTFALTAWWLWLSYAMCFCLAVTWLQFSLFAGCTYKTATSRMYSSADWRCLLDFKRLYQGAEILAYPATALIFVACAVLLLSAGIMCRRRAVAR